MRLEDIKFSVLVLVQIEACEKAGSFNENQLPPSMAPAEKTGKFEDS